MTFFEKMSDSAALVAGMATRLDIDLGARVAADPEHAGRSYAAMVRRCAQCSDQAACARLQDDNPMLDAPPSYCMNRDVLHR